MHVLAMGIDMNLYDDIFYPKNRIRKIVEVPSYERNTTLEHLDPSKEYFLQVVSVSFLGAKNESRPVLFVSPANDSAHNQAFYRYPGFGHARKIPKFRQRIGTHQMNNPYASPYDMGHDHNLQDVPFVKIDEAVIVIVVLGVWFGVIVVFCNQWGKIRHLEPYHPDFRKRESTDTEVIVDPFSSFSTPHYNPRSKIFSRMNTINTTGNGDHSASVSNFASLEGHQGVNFLTPNDQLSAAKRKTSLSLNEVSNLDHHRRTYSHGSGSKTRFNYQSFSPRLYHCQSSGMYGLHHHRKPDVPTSAIRGHRRHPALILHHPAFRRHATPMTPGINYSSGSQGRPSFSFSISSGGGYTPSRRHSSIHHDENHDEATYHVMTPSHSSLGLPFSSQQADEDTILERLSEGAVGGVSSNNSSRKQSPILIGSQKRHHSLLPLPPDFKLSQNRRIKSAEDLKSLVLEMTWASRRLKEDNEQLVTESYQ